MQKSKIFGATRQFHNTVQKYYILSTCMHETNAYISNLLSPKNRFNELEMNAQTCIVLGPDTPERVP